MFKVRLRLVGVRVCKSKDEHESCESVSEWSSMRRIQTGWTRALIKRVRYIPFAILSGLSFVRFTHP